MTCKACDERAAYMAADPEMYRGEDKRCDAHQIDKLDAQAEHRMSDEATEPQIRAYIQAVSNSLISDKNKKWILDLIESQAKENAAQATRIEFLEGELGVHENCIESLQTDNAALREEVGKLRATARQYIEAHKLMRTRFQDASDAETYTAAAKRLEELIDG